MGVSNSRKNKNQCDNSICSNNKNNEPNLKNDRNEPLKVESINNHNVNQVPIDLKNNDINFIQNGVNMEQNQLILIITIIIIYQII